MKHTATRSNKLSGTEELVGSRCRRTALRDLVRLRNGCAAAALPDTRRRRAAASPTTSRSTSRYYYYRERETSAT